MSKKYSSRERIIDMFLQMLDGGTINYKDAMEKYIISLKPIQVDFNIMRRIASERFPELEFYYDPIRKVHGIKNHGKISFGAIVTILVAMAGMKELTKSEIREVADSLSLFVADDKKSSLKKVLNKLLHDYDLSVKNGDLSEKVGVLCDHSLDKRIISFTYHEKNKTTVQEYEGVSYTVYFNNEHFYAAIYLINKKESRLFRVENIQKITVKKHSFTIPAVAKNELDELQNNIPHHD
ncbi:WYL domain-containing protein [Companilactobacillus musae]|uniref:WYL domain-containing protein n=1 Tax=Companilactobacillus musae TaxID=1903258 RepID=UPI000E64BF8F|nr:WYL domain-containing protein [Companilactobacillus musae]